ncbi:hypothetical protein U1Q18_009606, partial [Sarracenia purpurea var. burkii]
TTPTLWHDNAGGLRRRREAALVCVVVDGGHKLRRRHRGVRRWKRGGTGSADGCGDMAGAPMVQNRRR